MAMAMGSHEVNQTDAAKDHSHHMLLDQAVLTRHSSRAFLPQPVPEALLHKALQLASRAPSNSNTQPWRFYLATGPALARLKAALVAAASSDVEPNVPPLPPAFRPSRSEVGRLAYGVGFGIARDDVEARRAAVLQNWEFFGAPAAAVVCMSADLADTEALGVGMFLQTFLLGLTQEGIASCAEISIAGYAGVAKRELGIPDDLVVLCGVAIGYEDPEAVVNTVRLSRRPVDEIAVWVRG